MSKAIQRASVSLLRDTLLKAKPSIEQALPRHLSADRLIKVALVCVGKTPKLQNCTTTSVLQAVMTAAELGLDCGGALGMAYLVPYGDKCQLIVGYRGLVELARRSGQLVSIEAHAVYEGERFDLAYGLEPKLVHEPSLAATPDASKLVGCYVVARLKGGGTHVEWMSKAEIDLIRERSRASKDGPWVTDYIEMAKKTVLRRALKLLPASAEISRVLELEDDAGPVVGIATNAVPALPQERQSFGFGGGSAVTGDATSQEPQVGSPPPTSPAQEGTSPPTDLVIAARMDALVSHVESAAAVLPQIAEAMVHSWMRRRKFARKRLADADYYKEVYGAAGEEQWNELVPARSSA